MSIATQASTGATDYERSRLYWRDVSMATEAGNYDSETDNNGQCSTNDGSVCYGNCRRAFNDFRYSMVAGKNDLAQRDVEIALRQTTALVLSTAACVAMSHVCETSVTIETIERLECTDEMMTWPMYYILALLASKLYGPITPSKLFGLPRATSP